MNKEMSQIIIRPETPDDAGIISNIITLAFKNDPISDHREAEIVELLRQNSALSLSLVAEKQGELVGHIAFSKVHINEQMCDWYGLAPVSVLPQHQLSGIGSALIREGLKQLPPEARGCVVLGEPSYYQRFGFNAYQQLILEGVPAEYFQALILNKENTLEIPSGKVRYHPAFG